MRAMLLLQKYMAIIKWRIAVILLKCNASNVTTESYLWRF